jgi:formate hydrogenlyase subunit 3/multisubunit Na+/H+ antiporter MnhD subunit
MMFYKVVPLSSGFMLTSIIGAMISLVYVADKSRTWGFTFFLFFLIMFIASLVSMTFAPIDAEFDVKAKRKKR